MSNPGYTADIGGRIRIRGDNVNNSAGMWLYNTNTANDRAFIGLASAGLVGFYGTAGAGFGLQMNVTNGYVGIGGVAPTSPLQMASGASCTVGGVWTSVSDKNRKENFAAVNADDVLAKIAALPITQWNFKAEPGIAHIGPMAQDFHAAFNLGTDDKHIASVDEDGVALAAIQALNAEVRGQKSEVSKLKAENAELRARLDALEKK